VSYLIRKDIKKIDEHFVEVEVVKPTDITFNRLNLQVQRTAGILANKYFDLEDNSNEFYAEFSIYLKDYKLESSKDSKWSFWTTRVYVNLFNRLNLIEQIDLVAVK